MRESFPRKTCWLPPQQASSFLFHSLLGKNRLKPSKGTGGGRGGQRRCLLKCSSCQKAGVAPTHPLANAAALKQRTQRSPAFNAFSPGLFQLLPRLMTSCLVPLWARRTTMTAVSSAQGKTAKKTPFPPSKQSHSLFQPTPWSC